MADALLLLGAIILIGVVGNALFSRTRIPESLFLIITGLLIGPVLGIVPSAFFSENLGFFVSFALVIVLVNSGMNLDLRTAVRTMRDVLLFTALVFVSTVAIVTAALHILFGWPLLHGIFLGIIVSGTTTVTITHLVSQLDTEGRMFRRETKELLVLESIFNDVTVIAGASILVAIIAPLHASAQSTLTIIFNELAVSVIVGTILGALWVLLYAYRLHASRLSYIFTVGVALLMYAIAEFLGLNGAITVISFAVLVGNYPLVLEALHRGVHRANLRKAVDAMRKTDVEFTFLIRTFFFVLLGIVFDPGVFRIPLVLLVAATILVCKLLARLISSLTLGALIARHRGDHSIRTTLVANGFTATLAGFLGVQAGIAIPHLAEIVLLLVILTTATAILSTAVHQIIASRRPLPKRGSAAERAAVSGRRRPRARAR